MTRIPPEQPPIPEREPLVMGIPMSEWQKVHDNGRGDISEHVWSGYADFLVGDKVVLLALTDDQYQNTQDGTLEEGQATFTQAIQSGKYLLAKITALGIGATAGTNTMKVEVLRRNQ